MNVSLARGGRDRHAGVFTSTQVWRYGGRHCDLPPGGAENPSAVFWDLAPVRVPGPAGHAQRRRCYLTRTSHPRSAPGSAVRFLSAAPTDLILDCVIHNIPAKSLTAGLKKKKKLMKTLPLCETGKGVQVSLIK